MNTEIIITLHQGDSSETIFRAEYKGSLNLGQLKNITKTLLPLSEWDGEGAMQIKNYPVSGCRSIYFEASARGIGMENEREQPEDVELSFIEKTSGAYTIVFAIRFNRECSIKEFIQSAMRSEHVPAGDEVVIRIDDYKTIVKDGEIISSEIPDSRLSRIIKMARMTESYGQVEFEALTE